MPKPTERSDSRGRILLGFVLSGLLLGPALASWMLTIGHHFEERIIERALLQQVQAFAEDPGSYAHAMHPQYPMLRILGTINVARLPLPMLDLADGVHEYDGPLRNWHIALLTRGDQRYAALQDTSNLEQREWLGVGLVVGGTLLAVGLSLTLGFFVSNRLFRPLRALAARVSDESANHTFADEFPDFEVGQLARALDDYQQRWQHAVQREREFSADASHELRTPLAVVRSAAELIDTDTKLSPSSRRANARILDATQEMQTTITSLLYLVHSQSTPEQFPVMDVASCLDRAIDSLTLDESMQARLQLDYQARPGVAAPEGALRILASNLIDNALKYSGDKPVLLTLLHDRLIVTDQGPGIAPKELSVLMELGNRGGHSDAPGWGIGLSLSKRLAHRFGWTLSFASQPEGGLQACWTFESKNTGANG